MEISPEAMALADQLIPHIIAAVSEREDLTARPEEWHGTPGEWVQHLNGLVKAITPLSIAVVLGQGAMQVAPPLKGKRGRPKRTED